MQNDLQNLMKLSMSQLPRRNNMAGRFDYKTQKLHPRASQSIIQWIAG